MEKHCLFVAPAAYPLGGVAVWLAYLVPGLVEAGWNVTLGLVSGRYHDVDTYCRMYPELRTVVVPIPNSSGSRQGRINSLVRTISQYSPDLVVGVNIPDTYVAVNRLRKKNNPAPRVAMAIHGIQPDLLDDMAMYRDVLDGIICTNRLTVDLARQDADVNQSRLLYAPYGVEIPSSIPQQARGRQKKLVLAWVGRVEQPQKRIDDLVEIVQELVNRHCSFTLVVAGTGPEDERVRKTLVRRGLAGYVTFLGLVDPADMRHRVYEQCAGLLVTSYWETGPIVIWEAMAAGVPVVSSRYIGSGLEGGLQHGTNCLLFDIGDIRSAADQVELLQDPDIYQLLVQGGYQLVSRRYSIACSVTAWNDAMSNIMQLPVKGHAVLPSLPVAGRLDRLLGACYGERIRNLAGLRFQHTSAGGEWPHSYGRRSVYDKTFWRLAGYIDKNKNHELSIN